MNKKLTQEEKKKNKALQESKQKKEDPKTEGGGPTGEAQPKLGPEPKPFINIKQGLSFANQLGALIYYEVALKGDPGDFYSFESLASETQHIYVSQASRILVMLEKMNVVLIGTDDLRLSSQQRLTDVAHIETIILEFMKVLNLRKTGKHKTVQKKIDPLFFPAGELAHKIVSTPQKN